MRLPLSTKKILTHPYGVAAKPKFTHRNCRHVPSEASGKQNRTRGQHSKWNMEGKEGREEEGEEKRRRKEEKVEERKKGSKQNCPWSKRNDGYTLSTCH